MPQLTTLIPSFAAPVTDRVWLVGAHGGAGCTTIRHSDPDRFADAGRALPVSQDPSMPSRIILCAMGTGRGLESLRALLADQSAGLFGASILLGAAITDPVPRMPRPLVAARIQLSSAVRVWRLPHIKGLELDGFPRRVFLQIGVHSMGTIFQQHRRLVSSRNCVVGSAAFFLVIWS